MLRNCVTAHVAALNKLVETSDTVSIAHAIEMLRSAQHVYIADLRHSRPIAAYLSYALTRSERPCSLLDFAGGMAGPQIAAIRPDDLLAANSQAQLYVDAGAASAFQPISATIGLVQTLITALTWTAPDAK